METLPIPILVAALCVLLALSILLRRRKGAASTSENPASGPSAEAASDDAPSFPAGPLVIFFGSQTGTAEGFAQQLANEGKKYGFDAKAYDLEDFDESEMADTSRALFMMATYGEGEPTDNAAPFMKWAQNEDGELASDALQGMQYAVFGLGNREYEHFNAVGKVTDSSLEKLGAARIFKLGLGDDDQALDDDFETWRNELWPELLQRFHPDAKAQLEGAGDDSAMEIPAIPFEVTTMKGSGGDSTRSFAHSDINASTKHYFTAVTTKVLVNRELRSPKDGGSTRHMELDIHDADISYQTADNLAVLPENDDASVRSLAESLGYDPDLEFKLDAKDSSQKHLFPTPCTVHVALKSFCDIHGIPRRSTLKDFVPFVTNSEHREALIALTSKEGRKLYKETIEDAGRSLFEIIVDMYPSFKIPLAHFLVLVPRLQPRYYTISSSSTAHPKRIHLTVSVITQSKPDGTAHHGTCSTFLQRLEPPSTQSGKRTDAGKNGNKRDAWPCCRVFVRDSSFRLPKDPRTPVLLIGPGTGIAPMRALLQEREAQRQSGVDVGPAILYFGCKNRDMDFLYEDELEGFRASGALTTLHLAFSREMNKKVYVQHVMARPENAQETWRLVNDEAAHIYVCGGTSMGSDVGKVLLDIVESSGSMSSRDATKYVDNLKTSGRYIQELWA